MRRILLAVRAAVRPVSTHPRIYAAFKNNVKSGAMRARDTAKAAATKLRNRNVAVDIGKWTPLLSREALAKLEENIDEFGTLASSVIKTAPSLVPTLLANCTPTQLNILFTAPADCFPNMFRGPAIYILREQRILRAGHLQEVLRVLSQERLADLSLHARAVIIRALHKSRLSSQSRYTPQRQQAQGMIVELLRQTKGLELTHLKLALCIPDSRIDLDSIINALVSESDRAAVLQHFVTQAETVGRTGSPPLQIVADFDDTIILNWADARYPRKTVYPGVLPFLLALRRAEDNDFTVTLGNRVVKMGWWRDIRGRVLSHPGVQGQGQPGVSETEYSGSDTGGESEDDSAIPPGPEPLRLGRGAVVSPDGSRNLSRLRTFVSQRIKAPREVAAAPTSVAVITARPAISKAVTIRNLQQLGISAMVLSGTVLTGRSNQSIATKKFSNFETLQRLFPEMRFIMMGDSGQGDAVLADLMLTHHKDKVLATFVHDLDSGLMSGGKAKEYYKSKGVLFFNTYIGAAKLALKRGLITRQQAAVVIAAAWKEFNALSMSEDAKRKVEALMEADELIE